MLLACLNRKEIPCNEDLLELSAEFENHRLIYVHIKVRFSPLECNRSRERIQHYNFETISSFLVHDGSL